MTLDSIDSERVSIAGVTYAIKPEMRWFLERAHANQWPISVVIFAGSIKEAARVSPCSSSGQ